jgi:hypothetical protein
MPTITLEGDDNGAPKIRARFARETLGPGSRTATSTPPGIAIYAGMSRTTSVNLPELIS